MSASTNLGETSCIDKAAASNEFSGAFSGLAITARRLSSKLNDMP